MKSMASKEPRPGADIVTTPDAGTTHARIYMRVSTHAQELTRQESLIEDARRNGFYVAGVYRETASGARPDRPELTRLVADLQKGDVVIAERLDHYSSTARSSRAIDRFNPCARRANFHSGFG